MVTNELCNGVRISEVALHTCVFADTLMGDSPIAAARYALIDLIGPAAVAGGSTSISPAQTTFEIASQPAEALEVTKIEVSGGASMDRSRPSKSELDKAKPFLHPHKNRAPIAFMFALKRSPIRFFSGTLR